MMAPPFVLGDPEGCHTNVYLELVGEQIEIEAFDRDAAQPGSTRSALETRTLTIDEARTFRDALTDLIASYERGLFGVRKDSAPPSGDQNMKERIAPDCTCMAQLVSVARPASHAEACALSIWRKTEER